MEHDYGSILANSQDECDLDDAQRTLEIFKRLRMHLSDVFPDKGINSEPSILHHDDLSQRNIMVDDHGGLSGVVDWECVSAVPLWKACDYPCFLNGDTRPDQNRYKHDCNGDPNSLYWVHLEDYELTRLRCYYINEMQKREPGWVEIFRASERQRDFEYAMRSCDTGFFARRINEWIDGFASGKLFSLRDE